MYFSINPTLLKVFISCFSFIQEIVVLAAAGWEYWV